LNWPPLFGVMTQVQCKTPDVFNLLLLYSPLSGEWSKFANHRGTGQRRLAGKAAAKFAAVSKPHHREDV